MEEGKKAMEDLTEAFVRLKEYIGRPDWIGSGEAQIVRNEVFL